MKKNFLSGTSQISWGRVLLPIGLLIVAIAGILRLYEVQTVFFPVSYHATELKLMRKECGMINKGLTSLRAELGKLNAICISAKPTETGAPLPEAAGSVLPQSDGAWPATLHAAKKKRVYIARKLKNLNTVLQSKQQVSNDAALSVKRPEFEKIFLQMKEIQIRCNAYNDELRKLSQELNRLEGCGIRGNSKFN